MDFRAHIIQFSNFTEKLGLRKVKQLSQNTTVTKLWACQSSGSFSCIPSVNLVSVWIDFLRPRIFGLNGFLYLIFIHLCFLCHLVSFPLVTCRSYKYPAVALLGLGILKPNPEI